MTTTFIHDGNEFEFLDIPIEDDDEYLLVQHDENPEQQQILFSIQKCGCLWRTFYEMNKQGGLVQTWHRVRRCKKALQLIAEDRQMKDIMKGTFIENT